MAEPLSPNKPFFQTPGGKEVLSAIHADKCGYCGAPATLFSDELSQREYLISGMCQKCQDDTFGTGEE